MIAVVAAAPPVIAATVARATTNFRMGILLPGSAEPTDEASRAHM
jgi:hypothetical protein